MELTGGKVENGCEIGDGGCAVNVITKLDEEYRRETIETMQRLSRHFNVAPAIDLALKRMTKAYLRRNWETLGLATYNPRRRIPYQINLNLDHPEFRVWVIWHECSHIFAWLLFDSREHDESFHRVYDVAIPYFPKHRHR